MLKKYISYFPLIISILICLTSCTADKEAGLIPGKYCLTLKEEYNGLSVNMSENSYFISEEITEFEYSNVDFDHGQWRDFYGEFGNRKHVKITWFNCDLELFFASKYQAPINHYSLVFLHDSKDSNTAFAFSRFNGFEDSKTSLIYMDLDFYYDATKLSMDPKNVPKGHYRFTLQR